MHAKELIQKKRDGGTHTPEELRWLLERYLDGEVADYQMSAWLMAVFFRGMETSETAEWTRLMWQSGVSLPRKSKAEYWIDKHSTGGVGDKPSLILVPLVISTCQRLFGKSKVRIPMISGRGLGHTGGTLDKLDAVLGFSSRISLDEAMRLLEKNDFFMMGQTENLAPADRRLYALRDVTGTIESVPMIVSSILSKKLAESLDGLVLDIKVGDGAFMRTREASQTLAKALVSVARLNGIDTVAVFSRMDEPLGKQVGHQLELEECWDFLTSSKQDEGLYEVTLTLAAHMVYLASRKALTLKEARGACEQELSSGRPADCFRLMFTEQGGQWKSFEENKNDLRRTRHCVTYRAPQGGYVSQIAAREIGRLMSVIGGGRLRQEDKLDLWAGLEFQKKVGDRVERGEPVVLCYFQDPALEKVVSDKLAAAILVSESAPVRAPWILGES